MATPTSRELHCVVVTPERSLLDLVADFVALPMYDGELGVLPGRAPLIGRLGFGELRIRKGTETHYLYVDGGFVQVRANTVTVLTSRAMKAEEIKPEVAELALAKASEALHKSAGPEAQLEQQRAQQKAREQVRIARHAKA
jgi:F-type H+-transporting ATPase subunit epsilon